MYHKPLDPGAHICRDIQLIMEGFDLHLFMMPSTKNSECF